MSDCTSFKSKSLFLPTALAVLLITSGGTSVRAADAATPGEFVVERVASPESDPGFESAWGLAAGIGVLSASVRGPFSGFRVSSPVATRGR